MLYAKGLKKVTGKIGNNSLFHLFKISIERSAIDCC